MSDPLAKEYLDDALSSFRAHKKLAERAIAQIRDEEFFITLDSEDNSIAVIMKHIAGNLFSRWTDFLTSDGEKPNRNRDMEFVIEADNSKEALLAYWERGWETLFAALEPLTPEDFAKTVKIREQDHTIVQAINRQLTHYAYHIGQIVFLAKHFRSEQWKSLSVPKNRSAEFNAFLAKKSVGGSNMFLGLRTAVYCVSDIGKAKTWYSSILGIAPYFDEPFYVGFNVAGFELGLMPEEGQTKGNAHIAFWGVEDAEKSLQELLDRGATANEAVQDVGGGIKVASVKDPFGNVFGIIENPHFGG